MISEDIALVREYARSNSEQAFATLVSRYVNLVYSVALRQVRNPHLAEEITQGVFIILARKAKSLSSKTILSGWLCRTARYISADALKLQRRRQLREQESHMQSMLNESDSVPWSQIAPMLDEALNCLGGKEHDAVVLRFFDGKELTEVGAAMGTTEDAARMRVNRGLEKLRKFFAKKGVTLSTTAIAGAVAANSVQAAPIGLAATITTAAFSGTAITTAAAIAASKAVAMTTLQKSFITVVCAATVGTGIYEARQAANARAEVQTLQQQKDVLTSQIERVQHERDNAVNRLASVANEGVKVQNDNAELLKLRGEVGTLRATARDNDTLRRTNQRLRAALDSLTLNGSVDVNREPLEARLPEDQIPPGQMWFSNISADQIIRKYTNLSWEKVEVEGHAESVANIGLTYASTNGMTRSEAIKALEQLFSEQAGIEVSHPDESRSVLRLKE